MRFVGAWLGYLGILTQVRTGVIRGIRAGASKFKRSDKVTWIERAAEAFSVEAF